MNKLGIAFYWTLVSPVVLGHYLITMGDPQYPMWIQKYDDFMRKHLTPPGYMDNK